MRVQINWIKFADQEPPRDGTPFLAINHDTELWLAKYIDGRIAYRTHRLYEQKKYLIHRIDGKRLLEDVTEKDGLIDEWQNNWTFWARGYEFEPTHWALVEPPAREADE